MSTAGTKEIVIEVSNEREAEEAAAAGATTLLYTGGAPPNGLKARAKVLSLGTELVPVKVAKPSDVEEIYRLAKTGVTSILVEPGDIKIIPLENILAGLQGTGTRVYVKISGVEEAETMLGVLERGVDGIVYRPSSPSEITLLLDLARQVRRVELRAAKVTDIFDVGMGERACVDTTSMLRYGEGLLVGSMARMLFLVHNESVGSKFTPPRPFRVNAGSVHLYTMGPTGKTLYLSELRSGMRVLMVSKDGSARVVSIGRVKIERRPMVQINAETDGAPGSVTLQKAETIRLVTAKGEIVDVTSLSRGEEVLVWLSSKAARHMGMEVDEFIDEV
ncbi:MAG: 3-dehydroquinate synthase II [Nitrososphaerota archaeon]|nr:3-dehydroquinate synthase II [Candidatus Calditenuaceae archaeon]MDW8074075.1 3-dehydroquinate synthase II [Nitrososphaerota archaeon]